MTSGEQLPAGKVVADRHNLMTTCMKVGAFGVGVASMFLHASSEKADVNVKDSCGSPWLCDIDETYALGETIIIETSEPVIAKLDNLTTTTNMGDTQTTTPPAKSNPAEQKKSCKEIAASVTKNVPVAPGWKIVCYETSKPVDGLAISETKTIELYFGDPEDTNGDKQFTVAHEIAHSWQFTLGLRSEMRTMVNEKGDSETRRLYPDSELEKQADGFAYALGYREDPVKHYPTAAKFVCRLFRERGVHIC